uniref:Uncharacterized protein n=1 Tax=Anguilla anguilla TaxID=7936 RepID=A0A0E9PYY8_ANGAN
MKVKLFKRMRKFKNNILQSLSCYGEAIQHVSMILCSCSGEVPWVTTECQTYELEVQCVATR